MGGNGPIAGARQLGDVVNSQCHLRSIMLSSFAGRRLVPGGLVSLQGFCSWPLSHAVDQNIYDVVVVGGGMVGAALAAAIGESPGRVTGIGPLCSKKQLQHANATEHCFGLAAIDLPLCVQEPIP